MNTTGYLYNHFHHHQSSPQSTTYSPSSMSVQGQPLEVTVISCTKLRDTEWISRQDPYVCLEYGSTKYRTRTCTDGGKNPSFQEKFVFPLIEGLQEMNVIVWNSNKITVDDFIGSGKIQLHKAISSGYDDNAWPLTTKNGRHAGEVRLILHCSNANKPNKHSTSYSPSAPPYGAPAYSAPPAYPVSPTGYPSQSHYPPYQGGSAYPPPYQGGAAYPPQPYSAYPPPPSAYPPQPSAYPPPPSVYPPQPSGYPSAYPPSYPPGGHYPAYPPPPY